MEELKILEDNMKISKKSNDTIKNYKSSLKKFIANDKSVLEYATNLKYKDEVSKFKCALKNVYNIDIKTIKQLDQIHKKKQKRKRKSKEQVKLRNNINTINAIRNKKLKLAFRLSLVTALRIKELSELTKKDLIFDEKEKRIVVHVEKGKGNKNRDVWSIMQDKYLFENLKKMTENLNNDDKIFYSRSYLGAMATKYNFQNHNFRANVLQTIYFKSSGDTKKVIELCQSYLGHKKGSKTYLYYMNRKINQKYTKFDI
jgi:integrase